MMPRAADFVSFVTASELVPSALLALCILALVLLAIHLENMFSAYRTLVTQARALRRTVGSGEARTEKTRADTASLTATLSAMRGETQRLQAEHRQLLDQLEYKKHETARSVVLSDVYVAPGERPYIATVFRTELDPTEPFAAEWTQGRQHVLYAPDLGSAELRFKRRFNGERGYRVSAVSTFFVPWADTEATFEAA